MPVKYNLNLYRGDTYRWTFVFWEDKEKTIPLDLEDALIKSQIRDKPDGEIIVELDCVVTLPNFVDVSITQDTWTSEFPLKGTWDLEITFPDAEVYTPTVGSVTVTPDVTRVP